MKLCDELRLFIEGDVEMCVCTPIEFERQVAVTLYYLSDVGRTRKTANVVGLSRSSVSVILHRVTRAISLQLGPKYIKVPMTDETVQVKISTGLSTFLSVWCNRWYAHRNKATINYLNRLYQS